jgi:hypothetical protein
MTKSTSTQASGIQAKPSHYICIIISFLIHDYLPSLSVASSIGGKHSLHEVTDITNGVTDTFSSILELQQILWYDAGTYLRVSGRSLFRPSRSQANSDDVGQQWGNITK